MNDAVQRNWAFTTAPPIIDPILDGRIRSAYRRATVEVAADDQALWSHIFRMNIELHRALQNADAGPSALSDPASSDLAYGFDNLCTSIVGDFETDEQLCEAICGSFEQDFRKLAQSIGVKRTSNPEGSGGFLFNERVETLSLEEIVIGIEGKFGSSIIFPNPFPREFGIRVRDSVVSQRVLPAIYQAWRLKQLSRYYGSRVVEIGAGFGRTAFYAYTAASMTDYTIIDLPLTNVAQATFLGRTLGPDRICLYGEPHRLGQIRIMPVRWFEETPPKCDIALNVDSLTEMPPEFASAYAEWAMQNSNVLLSMNHEANEVPVRDLVPLADRCVGRFPLMLRPGYMEEIFLPETKSPPRKTWWRIGRSFLTSG